MKFFNQSYLIQGSVDSVWHALTDPAQIEEWTQAPAEMSERVGASFKLWGGDIYGKNREVHQHEKLVQDWYSKGWKEPSTVEIELFKDGDVTRVELKHTNVPDYELEEIKRGWRDYYFGPLKSYVEEKFVSEERTQGSDGKNPENTQEESD